MKVNTSFDSEIEKIEKLNKNWLPWVGEKYFDLPHEQRLIIVGDSCYETEDVDVHEEGYIRQLIYKDGMQEGWFETNNFIGERHKKLEKILSVDPNNAEDKKRFWERVCYFNIIQRALKSSSNTDRPSYLDFFDGWEVFYQLVDILKPAYCLFNGVEAYNHLYDDKAQNFGYCLDEKKCELEKIDDVWPRRAIIRKKAAGHKTNIIFIKHTSLPLFPAKWQKFIQNEWTSYFN
jgi:hypothetical protein